MSDVQASLAISQRSHYPSDCQNALDIAGNVGSRRCPSFPEIRKFVGREKSSSVLSFNWKEDNLLKRKLSFLESMKKDEANAWLRDQKAFYKRHHTRLQTLELEHARLLGNKDLIQRLTSQNKLSNCTSAVVDQSEAAVKAIVQARAGWEGRTRLSGSPAGDRPLPPLSEGLPEPTQAQAKATVGATLKVDLNKERRMTTVSVKGSLSGREDKPALALSLDSPGAPEPGAQLRRLPVDSGPPNTFWSHFPDADIGRKLKDRFLQYTAWGDRHVEHPRKIRPGLRDRLHGPVELQAAVALLAQRLASLRRKFPMHEGAKCPEDGTLGPSPATWFLSRDDSPHSS